MKCYTYFALLIGVVVLVQGYTPFANRRPAFTNNTNYNYYNDNRQQVDLGSRIDQTPGQRKGPYGGDYVSSTSPFEIVYEWKIFEYDYPSTTERRAAIASGEYIPENTMPLGIDAWKDRFFISIPRWKTGTPATLVSLDLPSREKSPLLRPYPNWDFHSTPTNPDCTKFMSVFRIHVDDCGRLWAIDAGMVNTTSTPNLVCPPKVVVFDLATDRHLLTFPIPDGQIKEDSLYTSILVDIRDGKCDEAHAYVTDVWRNGLWVFSLGKRRSWRTSNYLMLPNPHACEYSFHNQLTYQWTDGIFGTALGLDDVRGDRLLYFHPMSSFGEFSVSTSILQNETIWTEGINVNTQFKQVGDRGENSQSSTSGVDRDGVLFYTLVNQDAIGCWDTNKPLVPSNIHHVDQNRVFLSFPNDIKVDKATDQGVWVLANNLPLYLYTGLDYSQVNVRILRAGTKNAVKDSVCDPRKRGSMNWG